MEQTCMEFEFKELKDFLSNSNCTTNLQKGDYVYEHNKQGSLSRNAIDLNKMYIIKSVNGQNLELISFTGLEKKIDLNHIKGFWWVLKLPKEVRMLIGLK